MKDLFFKIFSLSFVLFFALSRQSAFGQAPAAQLPNVVQASPDAASLGKFGDQQIGLNTGTPMVNVPLYTLKTKNLSVPIKILYSSNGIKVDELASRVGMGWTLNCGGVVTRTVYDKPDFEVSRITAPPSHNFHPYNPSMNTTNSSLYTSDQNLVGWMENTAANPVDMQADEYNFNFNGYTGKFIFDNNGLPVLMPLSNLKIEYHQQDTSWNFRITTPDGTKYYFGGKATEISTAGTGYSAHDQYSSSWYLNRIESAGDSTDYITFNYAQTTYGVPSGVSETVTMDPNAQPGTYPAPREYAAASDANANLSGLNVPSFKNSTLGVVGVYLKSINTSHYGILKFTYQNKPDVISGQDYLLQQMEVDVNSTTPLLYYTFNYDVVAPNTNFNGTSGYYAPDFFDTYKNVPRPFLKSVVKTGVGNAVSSETYSFLYNDMGNLPPHLSFAQDHWGYYNGKTNLNSIIFPGEADYASLGATIVNNMNVNRDVDYSYAQKGILTKVTYPTGGSTQFTYEGNSVNGQTPAPPTSGSNGGSNSTIVKVNTINVSSASNASATFAVTVPTVVNVTMNISCNCPTGGCTVEPSSKLAGEIVYNQNTNIGTFDFSAYNARGDCARSSGGQYTLQPGQYGIGTLPNAPYQITMSISTANGLDSLITNYTPPQGSAVVPNYTPLDGTFYGGVRVKTTVDTDPVTGLTKTMNYTYGGMSGSYLPLYEIPIYKYNIGTLAVTGITSYSAYTSSSFPLDYAQYNQFLSGTFSNLVGRNSHNVTYTSVTENFGTNFEGGGVDHTFSYNINNSASVTPYGGHNAINLSVPELFWRNGLELSKSVYKLVNNQKVPVQAVTNTYTIDPRVLNTYEQFNVKKNSPDLNLAYADVAYSGAGLLNDAFGYNKRESVFDIYSITDRQEWQYLSQQQTVDYDTNGQNPMTTTVNYVYDNPVHTQLTRKVVTNSDGKILTDLTTYPDDYAAGTAFIDNMKTTHLTGMPVEQLSYETVGSSNNILHGKVTQYLAGGTGKIDKIYLTESAVPLSISGFKISNQLAGQLPAASAGSAYAIDSHYNPRILFSYDNYTDPVTVKIANASPVAYQWGYNNQYPVAKVINATSNDIFYDSFEEGDGNTAAGVARTGHLSHTGPYSKPLTGLDAGSYILSYWQNISGVWTFVTSTVAVTGSTYTINLSVAVDDIRFYPALAQMTTYTYDPLIGITSITDAKNETTFYEYDAMLRLLNVRDTNGNIIKNYCYNFAGQQSGCPVGQISIPPLVGPAVTGSFVSSDLMDPEWKQEAPPGYTVAGDDGTTINAAKNAGTNAGRFAYFSTAGTVSPLTYINGTLSFTAKGSGTIEVQLISTNNASVQARKTFALKTAYQNFSWAITGLYPQLEMAVGVIVNGGGASSQATVQFQKNFSLSLNQLNLTAPYTRFRADSTTLIGNSEKGWYGWSDSYNAPRKKYLQHSAYSRMRFQTTARQIAIEYVRDFYDKRVVNLFALTQAQNGMVFNSSGAVVSGTGAVNTYTLVTAGQTYTISGLLTTNPTVVWFNSSTPLGAPQALTNTGTAQAPVYQVTAPATATNMGLLIQNTNDNYLAYTNCMVQLGAKGAVTQDGTIPTAFTAFSGYVPSHISGPAVFINGTLYKYYQVEGTDVAKVIQFVTDTLPAGTKTVEVMMPGQGTYLPADPHVRRAGTFLRAVYFPGTGSTTTVSPANTVKAGSIAYIHDSILSGYNISSDAQNNVWMMKTLRDPSYGFTGDIFSEGYAGRILNTDIATPALTTAFANKLASFGVDKFWFQIGVNDYGFNTPLPQFYTQYKSLITQLKSLRPNAKIYIQATGPETYEGPNSETVSDDGLTSTGPAANDFRDVQRALATTRAYSEYVNFEGLFPAVIANTADGIHPTDAGNVLYANGIKNKSSLLGTVQPAASLAFYRSSSRSLIQTIPGIYTITATGGTAPYTFALVSGTLPAGLTFNGDGTITGTPTSNGSATLGVKVTDAAGASLTNSFTLNVSATPTIVIGPAHIINAQVNVPYTKTFTGHYGYGPYTFSLTGGALPPGMSLSTVGVLSGTVIAAGSANFTLTAKDHYGFTGSTAYTLTTGTGTPAPLTDNLTITATVNTANHLILTAHLGDIYSQTLFAYIAAYFTPSGGSEIFLSGNNLTVGSGLRDGVPVDMGAMGLTPGNFSVRLANGGISPAALDGVTINYAATTNIAMSTTVSSPTEALSITATINSSGHLLVTASLPYAPSTTIYTSMGAIVTQGGSSTYVSGPAVNINAGTTSSGAIDFGLVPASAGSVGIQIYTGAVSPTSVDGKVVTFNSATNFTLTMPAH